MRQIEIFAESWTNRKSFSLYRTQPRPSCALFFICTNLKATFYPQDAPPVSAGEGDVVLIPQGICYHVRVEGGGGGGAYDTYTVNFRPFDRSGEELTLSREIGILTHATGNLLALRASKLFEVYRRIDGDLVTGARNQLQIKAAFYALLDDVTATLTEHSQDYYPIRVGVEALRAEWNQNEKIEKYAALCGVSVAYFYLCFRRWSGKSPVEYRNLLRLSEAEILLRLSDMRVGEIAAFVGFEDPFYFCRIFSKQFGLSPQHYRKAFRQDGRD